jgi:hypothetical protein
MGFFLTLYSVIYFFSLPHVTGIDDFHFFVHFSCRCDRLVARQLIEHHHGLDCFVLSSSKALLRLAVLCSGSFFRVFAPTDLQLLLFGGIAIALVPAYSSPISASVWWALGFFFAGLPMAIA